MALASAALAASGIAYLDAKFHFSKDLRALQCARTVKNSVARAAEHDRLSPFYLFEKSAKRSPSSEAIWTRDRSYDWSGVLASCFQYANFFLRHNVRPGDLVALCMHNSPDFVFAWLGLWAVGAAPAMINHNLAGEALVGCLDISTAKLVLVDDDDQDILGRMQNVRPDLERRGMIVVELSEVRRQVEAEQPVRPDDSLRKGRAADDPMALFYTSGSTGLPKACKLPIGACHGMALANELGLLPAAKQGDRCYACMPFYHGTGGITMMSQILAGSTVCIAPKFSVSTFWSDVRACNATWFIYVGETLRYLVAAPPTSLDRSHAVHSVYGNGCRPDVWERFKDRFGIDTMYEFYNSTEGPLSLRNEARGGFLAHAVGHHGLLQRMRFRNMYVPVRIDTESGEVIRDERTGLVERVSYDEGGEMLVVMPGDRPFPGYFGNEEATEKKYVRNVLKKGDYFYRTGDSMRRDGEGRWFFLDRLGDTFRWKGENVSTTEVAEVLGRYPGVDEAIVYGVDLPGHDGKAGAAALRIDPDRRSTFDFSGLLRHARSKLPKYAVPVFLRLLDQSATMHNNKQNKAPLKKSGVDPSKTNGDEILWVCEMGRGDEYVPFTQSDWDRVVGGRAKL